jgi:hypothetical protein
MRMFTGEQQQQFVFTLAERCRISCRFLHLPHAQAEIETLCGTFLRKTSSKPQFPYVKLYGNGLP